MWESETRRLSLASSSWSTTTTVLDHIQIASKTGGEMKRHRQNTVQTQRLRHTSVSRLLSDCPSIKEGWRCLLHPQPVYLCFVLDVLNMVKFGSISLCPLLALTVSSVSDCNLPDGYDLLGSLHCVDVQMVGTVVGVTVREKVIVYTRMFLSHMSVER